MTKPAIDEEKVARVIAEIEANVEAYIAAEEAAAPKISGIYLCSAPKVRNQRSIVALNMRCGRSYRL
jgi:hypothetical protein